jgi:glycosyltransferase involved in cell wall biosynthesis
MKISVCMTFFNRPEILRRTLQAYIDAHDGNLTDTEFVIIDDGSLAVAVPVVKDFVDQMNIRLFYRELKNDTNPAVAINSAVRLASHDYILLTSADVMPVTPVLHQLSSYKYSDNDYVLVNCYSLSRELQRVVSLANIKDVPKLIKFKPKGPSIVGDDAWYTHSIHRPDPLYFMALMKKQLFWQVGGIDEDFRYGIAYEDTEFCHRLKKNGVNILFLLESLCVHQYHYTEPPDDPAKWNRNRELYIKKTQ